MKRRIRTCVVMLAALGVAIITLWAVRPRSRPLGRFARHFHPQHYPTPGEFPYWGRRYWLDNRYQLLGLLPRHHLGEPSSLPFVAEAVRLDTTTGVESKLPGLSARLVQEQLRGQWIGYRDFQVSPDGRWVIITDDGGKPPRFLVITTDGERIIRWPCSRNEFDHAAVVHWLTDSRRWIGTFRDIPRGHPFDYRDGHVFDVEAPGDVRQFALSPRDSYAMDLGMTSGGRLLFVDGMGRFRSGEPARLLEFSLDKSPKPPITHIVEPPRGGALVCMSISNQGDRMAWLYLTHHSAPRIRFLQRALEAVGIRDRDVLELYVSRVDGIEMRQVGFMDCSAKINPGALAWAPDGKRVSFWNSDDNNVWVVPVD